VRDVFVASPGNVLIVSDLSQIELRMLAHYTQDKRLLRAYRENLDLHAITASRVFGPDFTPLQRTLAKNVNFSVIFGVGPATLARKYEVPSVKMARDLLAGFYASYRRVEPWKHETLDEARAHYKKGKSPPYIETILGRKRRLPELYSTIAGLRARAERQVISTRISGSAADLFKVVMIKCQDLLDEVSWEGHILMTVHDELVVEVPERWAEEGKLLVSSAMTDPVNPFTLENMLSVPVIADTKIVDVWGEAKG
jgi:DNA polymerase-1